MVQEHPDDGHLITVADTYYPDQFLIARWNGKSTDVLLRQDGSSDRAIVPAIFPTPDGEIWYAWHYGISRLVNGTWQHVGDGIPRPWGGYRVVNHKGPPWVLLQEGPGWLLRPGKERTPVLRQLVYDRPIEEATIEEVALAGDGPPVTAVYDALEWSPGVILLATDVGLRLCDITTGTLQSVPFPSPDARVWRISRDESGRLWLGGAGLWMCAPVTKELHDLSALPMIGERGASALGADPEHKNGVIVALGDHGVVYLQASRREQQGATSSSARPRRQFMRNRPDRGECLVADLDHSQQD